MHPVCSRCCTEIRQADEIVQRGRRVPHYLYRVILRAGEVRNPRATPRIRFRLVELFELCLRHRFIRYDLVCGATHSNFKYFRRFLHSLILSWNFAIREQMNRIESNFLDIRINIRKHKVSLNPIHGNVGEFSRE